VPVVVLVDQIHLEQQAFVDPNAVGEVQVQVLLGITIVRREIEKALVIRIRQTGRDDYGVVLIKQGVGISLPALGAPTDLMGIRQQEAVA